MLVNLNRLFFYLYAIFHFEDGPNALLQLFDHASTGISYNFKINFFSNLL